MAASEFTDKVVFVTGATSGIGRAVALAFAREGAKVVGAGRNEQAGRETERLAEVGSGNPGNFLFVKMDLAQEAEIIAALAGLVKTHGRLDHAVNCAAVDIAADLLAYTATDFDRIFNANVRGLFLCLREEIKAMKLNGGGSIVNVGSAAGQRAFPGNALYNASKAAAKMLSQTAAVECGKLGIRINELAPGPVFTPMLEGYFELSKETDSPATKESVAAAVPLGRILMPDEIANAVLFLNSAKAANITGASLAVDGGFVLG
jgi:NAD(P)-dependent dehydrogenase (short-subunit alcohol dehydrogenase family)